MITNDFNSFPKTGRIIGIDWGARRIGLAISDPDHKFVFTRPTLFIKNSKNFLSFPGRREQGLKPQSTFMSHITYHISQEDIKGIILGLPLRTDGTESDTTARVREFATRLAEQTDLPILLFDESLTSFAAEEDNMAAGRAKNENLDSLAAKIMLENALVQLKRQIVF